jgi:hypothetical protein
MSGLVPGKPGSLAKKRRTWRRRNSKRGAAEGRPEERRFAWSKASKSRATSVDIRRKSDEAAGRNGKGANGTFDEKVGCAEKETPERARDPGRGCGMKQAREVECGANRREVEKT